MKFESLIIISYLAISSKCQIQLARLVENPNNINTDQLQLSVQSKESNSNNRIDLPISVETQRVNTPNTPLTSSLTLGDNRRNTGVENQVGSNKIQPSQDQKQVVDGSKAKPTNQATDKQNTGPSSNDPDQPVGSPESNKSQSNSDKDDNNDNNDQNIGGSYLAAPMSIVCFSSIYLMKYL